MMVERVMVGWRPGAGKECVKKFYFRSKCGCRSSENLFLKRTGMLLPKTEARDMLCRRPGWDCYRHPGPEKCVLMTENCQVMGPLRVTLLLLSIVYNRTCWLSHD